MDMGGASVQQVIYYESMHQSFCHPNDLITVYVVSFQTIHWKLHIIGCLILLTQVDK